MKKILIGMFFLMNSAFAHPGHLGHGEGGLIEGFLHPVFGLDHLITALAVGIWAARMGGKKNILAIPFTFLSSMIFGTMVGLTGHVIPYGETAIAVSVVFFTLATVFGFKFSLDKCLPLLAGFGFFHGNAHGSEMPEYLSSQAFSMGLILSTAFLHVLGIGACLGVQSLFYKKAKSKA